MTLALVSALRDTSTFYPDGSIGMTNRPISGSRVVLEWCARSILTPRGSLTYEPGIGEDIRELVNGDFTRTQLEGRRVAYIAAMSEVDFVLSVVARLSLDSATRTANFNAAILIRDSGTYQLAVGVDAAAQAIASFGVAA